jgi:hypothetical protein
MIRRAVAAAGVLLVLASCTTSHVKPEADIDLGGSVQRAGPKPVAGARLSLNKEGDFGDVFLTFATFGFACLDRRAAPAICQDSRFATTDSGGRFTYHLKGKDTQSTFGYSAVLGLTTRLSPKDDEAEGSSTTYRFHVQTEKLDLPIRLWEPTIDAQTGPFGARVDFPHVPAGLLPSPLSKGSLGYTVEFARGTEIVWRLTGLRRNGAFDPRVLEDSTGTMRVIASASNMHVAYVLGQEVAIALRSGARAYESPLDPPLSRGRPCSVSDAQGREYPQSPCHVTDGTFDEDFAPRICTATNCAEPAHAHAVVDLGRRASVDLIVVRGCSQSCTAETSTDGQRWRVAGVANGEQADFPMNSPRPARYVRVSQPDALTEISVWSGKPSVPVGSLLVSPERFPTAQRSEAAAPSTRDTGISVWALVATGALGLAAGGLVVALVKRRKPAA